MMNVTAELDALLERLDRAAPAEASAGDALDAALAAPPRRTAAQRLADDPRIAEFRAELSRGLVRIDTVRGFLELLSQVLAMAQAPRG